MLVHCLHRSLHPCPSRGYYVVSPSYKLSGTAIRHLLPGQADGITLRAIVLLWLGMPGAGGPLTWRDQRTTNHLACLLLRAARSENIKVMLSDVPTPPTPLRTAGSRRFVQRSCMGRSRFITPGRSDLSSRPLKGRVDSIGGPGADIGAASRRYFPASRSTTGAKRSMNASPTSR
jgi:hypothetical protein